MKNRLLLAIIFFIKVITITAQTSYSFEANTGDTIYMHYNDILTSGNLISGNTYTVTACAPSGQHRHHIDIRFNDGLVFPDGSSMSVYNGMDTLSPLIYSINSQDTIYKIAATCSNVSGCLTMAIDANSDTISFLGKTYSYNLSCCQKVDLSFSTNPPMQGVNNEINICQGEEINFNLDVTFPDLAFLQSYGWGYDQDISTYSYKWCMDDDSVFYGSSNINYAYNQEGGYRPAVIVSTWEYGTCPIPSLIIPQIQVSQSPNFSNLSTDSVYCFGDNINLGGVIDTSFYYNKNDSIEHKCEDVDIPDGTGVTYKSKILLNNLINDTIQSVNDIVGIFSELYHTYASDLLISISCPNEQSVTLHYSNGHISGTNLGGGNGYGPCYEYGWSPTATNGCWNDQGSVGDLPAGMYESEDDLSGLIGCPLNGEWTLSIQDTWASDPGHLCCWWIEFDSTLYSPCSYENYYTPESWTTQSQNFSIISGGVASENATAVYTGTTIPDTGYFTYSVIDNFGCEYDTTISVVIDECNDIERIINNNVFIVYPNPANNNLQLTVDNTQLGKNIEILDITGKLLMKLEIQNIEFRINISDLENGVYFVKIGNKVQKFIKE